MMILRTFDKTHKALYEKKSHWSVIQGKIREKGGNLNAQSSGLFGSVCTRTHVLLLGIKVKRSTVLALDNLRLWVRR